MADLERHVSTKGKDASGNGTATSPFRTIQHAAADLRSSLGPNQTGKILVEPGLYEEVVVLTDNMQLLRTDGANQANCDVAAESISENQSPVRIKRPASSSAPDDNTTAPTWPEVVKIHGSNVVVAGMRIEGDQRPQRVVFVHQSKQVTIRGCVITGGSTKIIYTGKGTGTKSDPFHSKVLEEGEGGGMRIFQSTNVTVTNCSFADNHTELRFQQEVTDAEIDVLKNSRTWKAGVLLGQIDPAAAEQKLRQAQPVRNGGGHLSCFESSGITVEDCFFDQGSCGGRGGAVQMAHQSSGTFNKCLFRNNESGVDGGAFAFSDPDPNDFTRGPIVLTGCKFLDNKSGDDGGGAYFTTKAQVTMSDCLFKGNQAVGNGGGMRVTYGSSVSANNCTFRENQANTDSGTNLEMNRDGGGGVSVNNSTFTMTGGRVLGNSVGGFAGGGVYFITAAFNKMAEQVADITHGKTFEKILRDGYQVTSVALTMTNVILSANVADGETCVSDVCTTSPRSGFKASGAGGAIYALGAGKDLNLPATVTLTNVNTFEDLSTHVEDRQKAEIVLRNLAKVVVIGGLVAKHPKDKFAYSLIDVHDADMTGSPNYAKAKSNNLVHEEGSSVTP